MFVAWVYDCGELHTKSGRSGYLWWLGKLRSGNLDGIIERVSLDPEANRWEYDAPLTFRGGIIDAPMAQLHVRVSESVGEGRLPPRMR